MALITVVEEQVDCLDSVSAAHTVARSHPGGPSPGAQSIPSVAQGRFGG
jgi:hypothetical protein